MPVNCFIRNKIQCKLLRNLFWMQINLCCDRNGQKKCSSYLKKKQKWETRWQTIKLLIYGLNLFEKQHKLDGCSGQMKKKTFKLNSHLYDDNDIVSLTFLSKTIMKTDFIDNTRPNAHFESIIYLMLSLIGSMNMDAVSIVFIYSQHRLL